MKLEDLKEVREAECDDVTALIKQNFHLIKIVKIRSQDSEKLVYVLGK